MKKLLLSLVCIALVSFVISLTWLYQKRSDILLSSPLGRAVASASKLPGYGNEITARESSIVLAKVRTSGLLASGAYNGRIAVATNDAEYTRNVGFQWPWNNIIEVIDVNQGELKRQSHAVFQDRKDFVFSPDWSKDGNLLFSIGERDQYSSFDLARLNPANDKVHPIATGLASGPAVPSSDGRFVAYVEGGHSYPTAPVEEQFLRVRDMKTDKVVGKSLGFGNYFQMSWLSSDILLFNMSAPAKRRNLPDSNSIWQINAFSGKSELFRRDAFSAQASPDGKWFTCLSYDNPSTDKIERALPIYAYRNPATKPPPLYIILCSADQSVVKTVTHHLPSFAAEIIWTADSKRFAIYESSRQNWRDNKLAEDVVRIYNVKSQKIKRIGKVQRPPQKLINGSMETVSCAPINFTKDGNFLLFSIGNWNDKANRTILAAFDSQSGTTQTWFSTSVNSLSWLEN